MTKAIITEIFRYPVKGLTGERQNRVALNAGQAIAYDRAWAIEAGTGKFDPNNPRYLPKINYLMLMRDEKLAGLDAVFDETNHVLTILRNGKQVTRGSLDQKIGRQLLEQFFAAFLPQTSRGMPKIVGPSAQSFSDVSAEVVSIINLATVRDIERVTGVPVHPMRFRGNIYIDGIEPWEEFNWLDKSLTVNGMPVFEVASRIKRCAATNVDPLSGKRDLTVPRTISSAFGHEDCGIYASVTNDAVIKEGDMIDVAG